MTHAAAWLPVQVKLEETFGELNVWLAAENGIYMRPPGLDWITLLEVPPSLTRAFFNTCMCPTQQAI